MARPVATPRFGKLVEVQQRDVELAHRSERPRHPPHVPPRAIDRLRVERLAQHRQRLAQPPRRHARLMDRSDVARLRRRHGFDQCLEPLSQQHEKGGAMVHARMSVRPAIIPITPHASRSHRHRHQLGPHDRGAGAPRLLVRGHRSRKGDGPARRRRARRQEADARGDERSALQALSKFERLADSHQVDEILAAATSATREAENGGEFLDSDRADHRHPPAHHHRHRGSAADPPGRGLRRRHAENGGRHRHRRRQRRDHARHARAGAVRPQLQDRRHPPDRALRHVRSAQRPRRAQDGRSTSASRSIATSATSSRPASTG